MKTLFKSLMILLGAVLLPLGIAPHAQEENPYATSRQFPIQCADDDDGANYSRGEIAQFEAFQCQWVGVFYTNKGKPIVDVLGGVRFMPDTLCVYAFQTKGVREVGYGYFSKNAGETCQGVYDRNPNIPHQTSRILGTTMTRDRDFEDLVTTPFTCEHTHPIRLVVFTDFYRIFLSGANAGALVVEQRPEACDGAYRGSACCGAEYVGE